MRTLSANATAALAENLGTEPIYIITIQWRDNAGVYRYADRPIPVLGIEWLIQDASDLDAVITSTSDSQQVNVTLDDSLGIIKNLMNYHDLHKRAVWVYQWFDGFSQGDAILLFKGEVNSPITWSAMNRTVSFDIVTKIEDMELGFSPEEGEFNFIANELIGQAWPMCFGTCVNSKTLKLTKPAVGITADGIAIADPAIDARISALQTQITLFQGQQQNHLYQAALALLNNDQASADYHQGLADDAATSWQNRQREINDLQFKYNEQLATVVSSFRMFNAEDFPEGTVDIRIGELYLTGYKDNGNFIITSMTHPKLIKDPTAQLPYCDGGYTTYDYSSGWGFYRGPDDGNPAWQAYPWIKGDNDWGYYYENPGSNVYLVTNEPQEYIVSLIPGTVTNVSTLLQREGQKFLAEVSEDKWTDGWKSYGPVGAHTLYITDALSKEKDVGYSDELYVTFISSVGPNTIDVLKWAIDNYTDLSYDTTSFDYVRTRLTNYPSHFSTSEKFKVMDFLHEVAWQARCQLRLVNDVFFITYLPEVPTSVATITESEIHVESFELDHTSTENLTTKMVCNWWATGIQEKPNRAILRHNVAKYGIHENTYDFFIYNKLDFVLKSATFWMIRYANTWKIARFTTPLKLLAVETQDAVTLDFSTPFQYVSNGPIVTLVEEASYNSADRSIQFQCWTGVKAGSMEQYDFAYPADVDSTLTFPTPEEIEAGYDGGWGNNKKATGELGTEALESRVTRVEYTINDPMRFGSRQYNDRGSPTPSDSGDSAAGSPVIEAAPILSVANPGPYLDDITEYHSDDPTPSTSAGISQIDLHSTLIYDSTTGLTCTLDTFFEKVDPAYNKTGNHLHAKTDASWYGSGATDGRQFLFQYDTDIESWGAGLAYFYEEE